ncbi:MAG: hypothetical protein Q4E54_02530 [Lachnospiraceae bacterium]|nr:hypothetical protein [Lachnospiraceae bacterium]
MKYEKNRKIAGLDEYKVMKVAKILIIPVIVVILVIVILLADSKNKKPKAEIAETVSVENDTVAVTEESEIIANNFDKYGLQQNAVPEVNELVAKYQRAKVTGDAELMYSVFGKEPDEDIETLREKLAEEAKVYESYDNSVCYTTPGCEEDSYLVYIASDLKFSGIDTPAPMLTWAYVCKDRDGNYYMIEPDKLNEEQKELLSQISKSEDVMMLDNDMRTRLAQAVINDAQLAKLYQLWSDTENAEAAPDETDPNAIHIENEDTTDSEGNADADDAELEIKIGE